MQVNKAELCVCDCVEPKANVKMQGQGSGARR